MIELETQPLHPTLRRWTVAVPGCTAFHVEARNWLEALGRGLESAGIGDEELGRLACEVLPNGTVIVNDLARQARYVVQRQARRAAA